MTNEIILVIFKFHWINETCFPTILHSEYPFDWCSTLSLLVHCRRIPRNRNRTLISIENAAFCGHFKDFLPPRIHREVSCTYFMWPSPLAFRFSLLPCWSLSYSVLWCNDFSLTAFDVILSCKCGAKTALALHEFISLKFFSAPREHLFCPFQ